MKRTEMIAVLLHLVLISVGNCSDMYALVRILCFTKMLPQLSFFFLSLMSGTWPLVLINRLEPKKRGSILHQASSMNNLQSYNKTHARLQSMYKAQG